MSRHLDVRRIAAIVRGTTQEARTGPEVAESLVGKVRVVEVFAMPHESAVAREGVEMVDVVFMKVGVHQERAREFAKELRSLLAQAQGEEKEILDGGPSYIHLGAIMGDQGLALRLMALGKVLGLWDLILPDSFGFIEPTQRRTMAGRGLIYAVPKKERSP